MVREHLSEELKQAGLALLTATDDLGMSAQGAMWVYSPLLEDWRYYLVTSLVDTAGRRKAYQFLLSAFELGRFPNELTIEDVHLGSPNEDFFKLISQLVLIDTGIATFERCSFNGVDFNGVIYRSVRHAPDAKTAKSIEKTFERRVRAAAA